MPAPDFPIHLDEALRALDNLPDNLRGVGAIRVFLESLAQVQRSALPPAPERPLEDYVVMENAYAVGARCLDLRGELIVISRVALLELRRKLRSLE